MKRFKPGKQLPPGFNLQHLQCCQALLASQGVNAELQCNAHELFACFDGWWLTSSFSPVASASGRVLHYAARLRIYGQFGQTLPANWLFAMNYAEGKTVALLKLIRALHLLNHLGRNGAGQALRIDLDPRICHACSDRIVDFSLELVAALQLTPAQVLFLLFIDQDTATTGVELVQRYRAAGYRVGLGGFGDDAHDLVHLWRLEPDFISLTPRFMRRAIMYPQVREQLLSLMPQLVAQGFELGVEDIVCQNMLQLAQKMQAKYYSGRLVSECLQPVLTYI